MCNRRVSLSVPRNVFWDVPGRPLGRLASKRQRTLVVQARCGFVSLLFCLLAVGCASTDVRKSNSVSDIHEKAVDVAYLDELNKHVVSIFSEVGVKADANRDANLSYGWQANPYVDVALAATTHYDLINRKSFFPIWESLTGFAQAQIEREIESAAQSSPQAIERFYQDNPAAAAAIAEHMVSAFLRHNIFVNLFVTPSAPTFLLPLTQETVTPGPQAASALNDLFGARIDPQSISLRVIDGSNSVGIPFAGTTFGSLAVVNEPVVRSVARELATSPQSVREVIVANESVHVHLNSQFGPIGDRKWPLDRLTEFMQPPFDLEQVHVEEFLSDVASIRTNDIGLQFAYMGLFLNAVGVDASGQAIGAASSRYGYSAEFFLRAFEKAEIEAGLPQAQRQAHILRQASGMADKRAGAKLVAQRPDPRVLSFIKNAYLEMGRRIMDTID